MEKFYKAIAEADWTSDDKKYPCYTTGDTWNGWGTPYFELDVAKKVMKDVNDTRVPNDHGKYNKKEDAFIVPEYDDKEVFTSQIIKCDDKEIKVYAIGAYSWCWDVSEEIAPKKEVKKSSSSKLK